MYEVVPGAEGRVQRHPGALATSPLSVASVERGGGVSPPVGFSLFMAISTELSDELVPSNEVSAMSYPVEAPESMSFELVLCRFACTTSHGEHDEVLGRRAESGGAGPG